MDTEDEVYGVPLNPVPFERISLTLDEAVAAWIMRRSGMKFNLIAARLGCNPARLGEIFRKEKHAEAADIAASHA